MANISSSITLLQISGLDSKLCNWFVDGANVVIETIPEYLARVTINRRIPATLVAILQPKEGYTTQSPYSYNSFKNVLVNYDCKLYMFKDGINDEHFVEFTIITEEPVVLTQHSVQGEGSESSKIMLVGDLATPGTRKYYGTNTTGEKGYHTLDTSGADSWIELSDTIPESFTGKKNHVPIVVDAENALDLIDTEILETILAEFTLLADCPGSYVGYENYYVRVKADGSGLYFSAT